MNNQKINDLLKDPRTNWKFICIVVILGFLAAGGILGYYYLWLTELETKLAEIEVKLPEKVKDETTDWKTYRNDKYGYEIKYPPSWYSYDKGNFLGTDLENCVGEYTNPGKVVLFDRKKIGDCVPPLTHGWFEFSIWIRDREYDKSELEKTGITKTEGIYDTECGREADTTQYEPITFRGLVANKSVDLAHNAMGDSPRTSIVFDHNGYGWGIVYRNDCEGEPADPVFEKMLSTFKLISTEDETANWKTYRNEEYGFEIRYPSEWQYKADKNYIGFYDPQGTKFVAPNKLTIRVLSKENNISLDKWVQELPEIKSGFGISGKPPSGSFRDINSISFYVIDTTNEEGANIIANAFLEKNSSVIKFSKDLLTANSRGIFDQILSTFRFSE